LFPAMEGKILICNVWKDSATCITKVTIYKLWVLVSFTSMKPVYKNSSCRPSWVSQFIVDDQYL
jgi:hypothetical protein